MSKSSFHQPASVNVAALLARAGVLPWPHGAGRYIHGAGKQRRYIHELDSQSHTHGAGTFTNWIDQRGA